MKELFDYLARFPVDHYGTSWVSAIQVVKETGISMEELWEITRRVKTEAFLDCITTNVPCAEGLLSVTIKPKEIHLLKSTNHYKGFIDSVKSRSQAVSPIDSAVQSDFVSHLSDIAIRTGHKIKWDPTKETIVGDDAAKRMMTRAMRSPWTI